MISVADYLPADIYHIKLILSTFFGVYTAYYFLVARSPPVLHGRSRKLLDFWNSYVPFLSEMYYPFVFGFTGRVQTILRPIFHRTAKCHYEAECLKFADGGETMLSWSNLDGMTVDTPIVILLPGLTGCGCCHYIASLVKEVNHCQYRCVVLNYRGTCHKLKTPLTYCASYTSDAASVFDHIHTRYPRASLVAVGVSLGALLVFNYLADEVSPDSGRPCPLTAAMCVCMPWNVAETSEKLEKSIDWFLFNYPLTHGLRKLVMRNADVLSQKYDVQRILKSRSVREFDQNLTVNMFGYKSVEEYYNRASPAAKIDRVRVPILCLNAADDPFVPFQTLPLGTMDAVDSRVVLALTRHGGHIGFLAGLLPTRPSLLDRAVSQFVSAVFQHPDEFKAAATSSVDEAKADGGSKLKTRIHEEC